MYLMKFQLFSEISTIFIYLMKLNYLEKFQFFNFFSISVRCPPGLIGSVDPNLNLIL